MVVVFSVIQTFSDFQLVYVLTRGGPTNSTHLFATLAYQIGIASGTRRGRRHLAVHAAVLVIVVWFQLRYMRRLEGA